MSDEMLPCCRCGRAPTVETYDGYPRVSCDCYSGPERWRKEAAAFVKRHGAASLATPPSGER